MDEDKLCLNGDRAKPFMKKRIGDRCPITLDAVLIGIGMRPDYSGPEPKKGKRPEKPYVEFVLRSVNGKSDKADGDEPDYKNMSSDDFEKDVAKKKGYHG